MFPVDQQRDAARERPAVMFYKVKERFFELFLGHLRRRAIDAAGDFFLFYDAAEEPAFFLDKVDQRV